MRDMAFYYPGPVWYSGDQVKNLILFFDGVALLVPEYIRDKPFLEDPALATGLAEHGLLEILEPETLIDAPTARSMAQTLSTIIQTGELDRLALPGTRFAELSYSRMGAMADERVASELLADLKKRGWARDSEDGKSIPMHPLVRSVILVLWAQLLRPVGRAKGLDLWPTTDRVDVVDSLREVLNLPSLPSTGHVVGSDLRVVGVDVASVPIDELLDFRRQYGAQYRAYTRDLRGFVRTLGPMDRDDRKAALKDRSDAIREKANELARTSLKAWKQPAARVALGIAGAAWTAHTGDPTGAAISLGTALLGPDFKPRTKVDAYSYLFSAGKRFPG